MKPKSILLLCVAGVCGLIAAVATAQHLAGNRPDIPVAPVEPVESIVVATTDIRPDTQITAEMLKTVEMPTKDLPQGAVKTIAELTGQTLRYPVFQGEPVLQGKLSGGQSSIARELRPGMKACLVNVSGEDRAITGLVHPGDHVDVYWVQMLQDLSNTSVLLLLQNAKVMAVGQRMESESSDSANRPSLSDNYTLEVTPQQHRRVQAARAKGGRLQLSLRGKGDTTMEEIDERELDMRLGLIARPTDETVVETPEQGPDYKVEYVIGNELKVETLNIPAPRQPVRQAQHN